MAAVRQLFAGRMARPRALVHDVRAFRMTSSLAGVAASPAAAVDVPDGQDYLEPPPALETSSAPPVKHPLLGQYEYDVAGDAPYPIWLLDPEGEWYQTILSAAQGSADVLEAIHSTTGMPWWATIMAGTFLLRGAVLPISIYALRNASKAFDAQGDIRALMRSYNTASTRLGSDASAMAKVGLTRSLMRGVRAALHKAGCYPWRTFATPFVHAPLLLLGGLGGRHLVLMGDESFETGGLAWFSDLTMADPTYMLPAMAYVSSYAFMEYAYQTPGGGKKTAGAPAIMGGRLVSGLRNTFQLWLLLTIPFTYQLPAGLYLGWVAGTAWAGMWVTFIRTDAAHRLLTGRRAPRHVAAEADPFNVADIPDVLTVQVDKADLPPIQRAMARYDAAAERVASAVVSALQAVGVGASQRRCAADWDQQQFTSEADRVAMQLRLKADNSSAEQDVTATMGAVAATGERPRAAPAAAHLGGPAGVPPLPPLPKAGAADKGGSDGSAPAWFEDSAQGAGGNDGDGNDSDGRGGKGGSGAAAAQSSSSSGGGTPGAGGATATSGQAWEENNKQRMVDLDAAFAAAYTSATAGVWPIPYLLQAATAAPRMHPELPQTLASPAATDGVSGFGSDADRHDFPVNSFATRAARRAARNATEAKTPLHRAQFGQTNSAMEHAQINPASQKSSAGAQPADLSSSTQGHVHNTPADLGATALSGAFQALRVAAEGVRSALGRASDNAFARMSKLASGQGASTGGAKPPARREVTAEQRQALAARVQALLQEANSADNVGAAGPATPTDERTDTGGSGGEEPVPMLKYPAPQAPAPFLGFGKNGAGWSSAAEHIARSRAASEASLLQVITSALLHGTPSSTAASAAPRKADAKATYADTAADTAPAPSVQGPMAAAAAATKQPFLHPGRVYREALLLTRHVLALEAPVPDAPTQAQVERAAGEAEHAPASSPQDLMESLAPHVDVHALASPAAQRRALERLRVLRAVVRATAEQTGVEPPPVEEAALYARGMVESVSWAAEPSAGGSGGLGSSTQGAGSSSVFLPAPKSETSASSDAAQREDSAVRHSMTVTLAAVDMAMSALQAARRQTAFASATDAAAQLQSVQYAAADSALPVAPTALPDTVPTPPNISAQPAASKPAFASRRRQRASRAQQTSAVQQPAVREELLVDSAPLTEEGLRDLSHADAMQALYASDGSEKASSAGEKSGSLVPPRVQRPAPWRSGGRAPLPASAYHTEPAVDHSQKQNKGDKHGEPVVPSEGFVTAQLPKLYSSEDEGDRQQAWEAAKRRANGSSSDNEQDWVASWQQAVQQDKQDAQGRFLADDADEEDEERRAAAAASRRRRHSGVGVPPSSASELPTAARKYALPGHAPAMLMPGMLLGERELAVASALTKQGLASRISTALLQGLERAYGGLQVKSGRGSSSSGASSASRASGSGAAAGGEGGGGDGKGGDKPWWGRWSGEPSSDGESGADSTASKADAPLDIEDVDGAESAPAREVMDAHVECWEDSDDERYPAEGGGGPPQEGSRGASGRTMIYVTQDGQEVMEDGMEEHDEATAMHSARAAEPEVDQWALLQEELHGSTAKGAAVPSHKERISELLSDDLPGVDMQQARERAAAEEADEVRLRSAVNPLAALYGTGEYESLDKAQDAWRGGNSTPGGVQQAAPPTPAVSEVREVDIASELTSIALDGTDEEDEVFQQWKTAGSDPHDTPTGVQAEDLTALMGPGAAADADVARSHPHTKRVVNSLWRTVLPALRSGMGANLIMPVPGSVQRHLEGAQGRGKLGKWEGPEPEADERTDLLKGILDDDADNDWDGSHGEGGSKK